MRLKTLGMLLLLACLSFPVLEQTSSTATTAPPEDSQAKVIAATINELRGVKVESSNAVPEKAQGLLKALKDGIRILVIDELGKTASNGNPELSEIKSNVLKRLKSVNVLVGEVPPSVSTSNPQASPSPQPSQTSASNTSTSPSTPYQKPAFGHIVDIALSRPETNKQLVILHFRLGLPCGEDQSLNGLEQSNDVWVPVFIREKNGYAALTGAINRLAYKVSSVEDNKYFVVSVDSNFSCGANQLNTEISALAVNQNTEQSEPLPIEASKKIKNATFENDPIIMEAGAFQVKLTVPKFFDRTTNTRGQRIRYKYVDTKFTQTAPLIMDKEDEIWDFIDDWFSQEWSIAENWVGGVAKFTIECRHGKIRPEGGNPPPLPRYYFKSEPQDCKDQNQDIRKKKVTIQSNDAKSTFLIILDIAKGPAKILNVLSVPSTGPTFDPCKN